MFVDNGYLQYETAFFGERIMPGSSPQISDGTEYAQVFDGMYRIDFEGKLQRWS